MNLNKLKNIINGDYFYYIAVAFLSFLISFFRIDYQSLWNDESISIMWAAKKPLSWIWENVPKYDLHPPLYYSVLHLWQAVFGDSVFSIRSLSAIFFIGSGILIYHFTKTLFASKNKALLTAIIFITNPFAVMYAQEVRSYSMLIFFILLNNFVFYKMVYQEKWDRNNYVIYFFSALIFIYSNILSLFVLATHFLLLLIKKDFKAFKKFFVIFVVLAALYLPVMKIIRNANEFDYSYYNKERFNIFLKTIVVLAGFIGGKINIWNGKRHIYGLLAASLSVYGILFAALAFKIRQINKFLLVFFVISFSLISIAAHIKFPVPDPKYFYVVFPFFVLLIGNLLFILKKRWQIAAVFLLVLVFNGIFLYNYFFVKKHEKENWKSVVLKIEENYLAEHDKAAIVISPVSEPHTTWQYYSKNIIPAEGALKYGASQDGIYRAMNEANTPEKDIVYLSRFIWELYDPNDYIRSHLEESGYKKTQELSDTKVEFWRYDKAR